MLSACVNVSLCNIRLCSNLLARKCLIGDNRYALRQTMTIVRLLCSREGLGLNHYDRNRVFMVNKMGPLKEKFRIRLEEYMQSPTNPIFTDDLNAMLYIAESKEDVQTCMKMVKRFAKDTANTMRFSSYEFGPLVMRLLHHLKNADLAYSLIDDKDYSSFFRNITSLSVLGDMLYEAGQYEKVLLVSNMPRNGFIDGPRRPIDLTILALASCLQLGDDAALEYAKQVLQDVKQDNIQIPHRCLNSGAYLAIKKGNLSLAKEFLNLAKNKDTTANSHYHNNIVLLYASQGQSLSLAIEILSNLVRQHEAKMIASHITAPTIFQETIDALQVAIDSTNDEVLKSRMRNFHETLPKVKWALVSSHTLRESLLQPIVRSRKLSDGFRHLKRKSVEGYRVETGANYYTHKPPMNNNPFPEF